MYSRLAFVFSALALATFATATPFNVVRDGGAPSDVVPSGGQGSTSSCSVNNVQCCNTVQTKDGNTNSAPSLFSDLTTGLSLTCTGIGKSANGGASCQGKAFCCQDNSQGVVSVGCVPFDGDLTGLLSGSDITGIGA